MVFLALSDTVGDNAALSLSNTSLPRNVVEHQIDMRLIAYSRGEGLELGATTLLLLSETNGIKHTLHFFHHWNHVFRDLIIKLGLVMNHLNKNKSGNGKQ
jgi:hypothetical protein